LPASNQKLFSSAYVLSKYKLNNNLKTSLFKNKNYYYLQGQGGMPINCFYHVFGERIDGEKLIIEYEGDTPDKYPGDQSQYSISGYHYDRRTL